MHFGPRQPFGHLIIFIIHFWLEHFAKCLFFNLRENEKNVTIVWNGFIISIIKNFISDLIILV